MVITRFLTCLFILMTSTAIQAETLRIAAAANMAKPLKLLIAEFKKQQPFNEQVSTASTGVLYQQIRHGAPFDILFAADIRRPELLEEQNLIHEKYRKTYALGQLALWSVKSEQPINLKNLEHYDGRIAIAAPHISPYGKATKEALISLNLWKKFHNNLITGNNISQTYQQTHTGAVDFGFIAASQLIDSTQGHGFIIDHQLHQPLEQQMVVLKNSANIELAEKFFEFVLSTKAQSILRASGYLPAIVVQPRKPQLTPLPEDENTNKTQLANSLKNNRPIQSKQTDNHQIKSSPKG